MGTLFGPLLGAAALHAISQVTRAVIGDAPGISLALYGALLVVMILFMPRGLAGLVTRRRRSARIVEAGAARCLRCDGLSKNFGGLQAARGRVVDRAGRAASSRSSARTGPARQPCFP